MYIYIHTVISQDTSLENTPTSHAVNLVLFMHACSDSANMLLRHALAYANGVSYIYIYGYTTRITQLKELEFQCIGSPST